MRKSESVVLVLVLLSFIVAGYLYPQMPDEMASHWNAKGEVDDYMSKFWGLFLMPIVLLGLWIMFLLIPKIDPLKENIEKFRRYFDGFIILITVYMLYIYLLTLLWNKGITFDMTRAITPAIGVLFYYVGVLVENAEMNWFIGIRTPWTLSDEEVWNETHKRGGKLFKIAGVITLLGLAIPSLAIFFMIVPVMLVSFYTIAFSYFEYQKRH